MSENNVGTRWRPVMAQEWRDDRKYVLDALERGESHDKAVADALTDIQVKIAMLNVKSGLWGAAAGAVPAAIAIGFILIKG